MPENNYFRQLPNFEYVTRGPNKSTSSDFTQVKNLFLRPVIVSDSYNQITIFDKYIIEGDDRPDTVAYKLYEDSNLDWIILIVNNIINVYSEWPLPQKYFENFLLEKYGSYSEIYATRYYETLEIKDNEGTVLVPKGLKVSEKNIDFQKTIFEEQGIGEFDVVTGEELTEPVEVPNPNYLGLRNNYFSFFDFQTGKDTIYDRPIKEVSNYEYELEINEKKRQIYVLKREYLNLILDQVEETLQYKKGSKQFVSESLKRVSNLEIG